MDLFLYELIRYDMQRAKVKIFFSAGSLDVMYDIYDSRCVSYNKPAVEILFIDYSVFAYTLSLI